MATLERVNLMLDPSQREQLEQLARQKKRSVSALVRESITARLQADNHQQRERQQVLNDARVLSAEILERRRGQPLPDLSRVIEDLREKRGNELLGH